MCIRDRRRTGVATVGGSVRPDAVRGRHRRSGGPLAGAGDRAYAHRRRGLGRPYPRTADRGGSPAARPAGDPGRGPGGRPVTLPTTSPVTAPDGLVWERLHPLTPLLRGYLSLIHISEPTRPY